MIEWLLTPLSGASGHHIAVAVSWHARAMVFAWGILVPLGVLVARYGKVTFPQNWPDELDNTFWWKWHRRLQYGAMAIALAGLVLAISMRSGDRSSLSLHIALGWAVMALGMAQVLSAWLRGTKGGPTGEGRDRNDLRGDHFDMTPRRVAFEIFHKFGGLLAFVLSIGAIVSGLFLADAPRWMLVTMLMWWAGLAIAAAWLQCKGRCIDTYQAIWGPDPLLPGNRRKPVGLGVRRVPPGVNPNAIDS